MSERWRSRAVRCLVVGGFALAAYYLILGGEYDVFDIAELERTRRAAIERVDSLQARVDSVARRADSLATDSLAVERLARERYGFLREGERLYRFVTPEEDEGRGEDLVDPGNPGG